MPQRMRSCAMKARRIAVNIAKLPELLCRAERGPVLMSAFDPKRTSLRASVIVLMGAGMPIPRFFSGLAFGPETVRSMSIALERVCEEVGLRPGNDAATEFVATKIIELAKRGVRSPDKLVKMTLQDLNSD